MAARLVRALASTAAFTGVALFSLAAVRERRQDPPATPSVLNMEVIPRTPERLARGSYLVNGLLWCQFCHSQEDLTQRPMRPVPGTEFGGQELPREEFGFPAGTRFVAPNISSDPEYGAGRWKDSDFVRALRQGIGHDGRTLYPLMPYSRFRDLSDEDLASVIVYVRSMPPVHVQRPKSIIPAEFWKGVDTYPMPGSIAPPDKSQRADYGKYLVMAARCDECHTPGYFDDGPLPGMNFAGGEPFDGPFGPHGSVVHIASLNITPDPSGISYFDEAMFIKTIRTGQAGSRELTTAMPWSVFRNLNDEDLAAIFAYLRTLPPVKHRVDNTEPPTYCKVCRNKHGFGNLN